MKHESESDWKQLGSLASGVLRQAAEKRMKQAEFMAAEMSTFHALPRPPQDDRRAQLDLPLTPPVESLADLSAGCV